MTKRDQSPHYIPELDPENNNTDGGTSDINRMHAFQALGFGIIASLFGVFLEEPLALKIGIGAVIVGVVLLIIVGLGQNRREERK